MDKEFTSDNCSVVPDYDQSVCCVQHDFAYWKGGTRQERREADTAFLECVKETRSRFLAPFRFFGVRVGGLGIFPTSFRWGYGWRWPTTKAPQNDSSKFTEESQLPALEAKLAEAREMDRRYREQRAQGAAAG